MSVALDKRKSVLNVGVAIAFKVAMLLVNLLSRRFLIEFLGNEINGLNSLYISILNLLSVAELGVGSAITFCMFKPIVDGDNDKVSALYGLFKKFYFISGAVIFSCGLIVMPFLQYLAKDYQVVLADVNLYGTFLLTLIASATGYLFGAKTSLINAYKNNYITTIIIFGGQLLQNIAQVFVLWLTRSFEGFLACQIVFTLVQWVATEVVIGRGYTHITRNKRKLDKATGREVLKNIKAMFMHKFGTLLVTTIDNIIISGFIGVVLLGKYANYTMIVNSMVAVITLLFTPLTSVIGHAFVGGDLTEMKRYYNFFYTFNFIVGAVFFLGYYGVIDNLVTIFFGDGLELSKKVSFVITLNYFISFMCSTNTLFRDATGTFYNDRWKPLAEGLCNLVLSVAFVYLFRAWSGDDEFAMTGVIVATIMTSVFIRHTVEPHVLFKYAFQSKVGGYYFKSYAYMALFALTLCGLNFGMRSFENQWLELLVNGCIAVGISLVPCAVATVCDKDFRHYLSGGFRKLKGKLHKEGE